MTEPIADIQYLCETIGVRPPLSQEEYEAAQFVKNRLADLGIETIEQPFFSPKRLAERMGPVAVLASIGLILGMSEKRWQHYLGTTLLLLAGLNGRRVQSGQLAFWEPLWPQQRTHNLIGRIPPEKEVQKRVVLIAHLDTDLERISSNSTLRNIVPQPCNSMQKLIYWGVTIPNGSAWRWLRKLMVAAVLAQSTLMGVDEIGDMTPGAISNASGIATLLHIAEELTATPLQFTEVVIAFTSCDTIGRRGTAELAAEYGEAWSNAHWIVVEGPGAGELCWVTASSNRFMRPETEIAQHLAQVATANPQLGVMGRPLASPDGARPLLAHQLNAVALSGYERADHYPVQWQRASDTLEQIESDSLSKASAFLFKVLNKIDSTHD